MFSPKARYVVGYVAGYIIAFPFAVLALLPKVLKTAYQSAVAVYDSQHVESSIIVAEMDDGALCYVEDPFAPIVDEDAPIFDER